MGHPGAVKRLLSGSFALAFLMATNSSAFPPATMKGSASNLLLRQEKRCHCPLFASENVPDTTADVCEDDKYRRKAHASSSRHCLYLFSLPAWNMPGTPGSTIPGTHYTLLVKRLWEWKDDVLGDGRDFFVPRPNTLKMLNELLRQQITGATECLVLSNCARFDVIVVALDGDDRTTNKSGNTAKDEDTLFQQVRHQLTQALMQQYTYYKARLKQKQIIFSLTKLFEGSGGGDNPKRLWLDPPTLPSYEKDGATFGSTDHKIDIKTLTSNIQSLRGPESIARYLCRVAVGLQPQGRRPDRQVVFRPYSSRDAHVMLQLKRTAEIADKQPRIKALLDVALQSGKAARDATMVPAILSLKKYADSSSRYSLGSAPSGLTEEAAKVSSVCLRGRTTSLGRFAR
jgi:hypothetical protein